MKDKTYWNNHKTPGIYLNKRYKNYFTKKIAKLYWKTWKKTKYNENYVHSWNDIKITNALKLVYTFIQFLVKSQQGSSQEWNNGILKLTQERFLKRSRVDKTILKLNKGRSA